MMLRLIYALLVLTSLFSSGLVQAQSQAFEAGYQAYMRNQFPVAEAHFKRALSGAKTREDRAFILKFLGISQYMRGDRKQAAGTFYQAFVNDPRTAIYQEEVLDPSVVDFYNSLRSRWVQQAQARQRQMEQQRSTVQQARDPAPPPVNRQQPETGPEPSRTADRLQSARAERQRRLAEQEQVKDTKPSNISWLHFMPFGIGQFYNGQPMWGTAYLGTQVFSAAIYLRRDGQQRSETKLRNDFLENPTGTQEQQDIFVEALDDRIRLFKQEAEFALIGFGLSWTISIIHGIVAAPDRSDKRFSLYPASDLQLAEHESLDYWYRSHSGPQAQFSFHPASNGAWLINMSFPIH